MDETQAEAAEREAQRMNGADPDFAPPLAAHVHALATTFAIPKVPARIEDRVAQTVKRALASATKVAAGLSSQMR